MPVPTDHVRVPCTGGCGATIRVSLADLDHGVDPKRVRCLACGPEPKAAK